MRSTFLLLCIFGLTLSTYAQEKQKVKEFGIITGGFSSTGFTYRTGNENALWRLNLLSGSISTSNRELQEDFGYSVSISFGREFRKQLKEKIEFRYGLDLNPYYQSSSGTRFRIDSEGNKEESNTFINRQASLSLNAVIGFNYLLSENMIAGAELFPGITYNYQESIREYADPNIPRRADYTDVISAGLSSGGIRLSFVYRF